MTFITQYLIVFLLSILSSFVFAGEVSITIDDFNIHEETMLTAAERNQRILNALKNSKAKAALFVVGQNLQDESDFKLLRQWGDDGHLIGNHTFSHKPYSSKVSLSDEIQEILRCEAILNPLIGFRKIFRFPMLAEGDTIGKRDQLRAWLKEQSYSVGSVTIDASDWYIDQRLREKIKAKREVDFNQYRDYYLSHIWDRTQYYNQLSQKVLGREVKHTLLLHFNLLNALFLKDLLKMYESKGWKIIDAKTAFEDPVFRRLPNSMPSGQSLIWALAKESGKFEHELRYPAEDEIYEKPKMDALGL